LAAFVILLVIIIIQKLFSKITCCIFGDIDIHKRLPDFWKSVENERKQWTFQEEACAREQIGGMKVMLDDCLEKAQKTCGQSSRKMKGLHTYDILANPNYASSFHYAHVLKPEKIELFTSANAFDTWDVIDDFNDLEQSEKEKTLSQGILIRAALGLAYLKDANNFAFDTEFLENLRSSCVIE